MSERVLVTGAASGFGAALAAIYASRGARVLVTDLAQVVPAGSLPAAAGGEVVYRRLDVRSDADWQAAVAQLRESWGGLDLLINNAGVGAGGRIDVVPLDDWEWVVSVNLLGVARGCHAVASLLKEQGSGRIVNVASLAGLVHPPVMASYNSTKAGVVALSETLLHELAPYGVGVTVICPAFFRTNLDRSIKRGIDPELEETGARLVTRARLDATTVARRAVAGIDKGRFLVLTHAEGRVLHTLKRLTPSIYYRLMQVAGHRVTRTGGRRRASQGVRRGVRRDVGGTD